MTNLAIYFIEANLALILFLVIYRVALYNETNFKLMRFYLLTAIATSLVLPLIKIPFTTTSIGSVITTLGPSNWLPAIVISAQATSASLIQHSFDPSDLFLVIYGLIFLVLLSAFARQVLKIILLARKNAGYKKGSITIIELNEKLPTFSFFNMIFIGGGRSLSENDKMKILQHETVHVQQFHSFDIMLVSFLRIVFWFNPLLSYFKKYFVQLHEFEADARAVESFDENKYCNLLARVALESADFSIANHFNNSLTLKRITMIRTIKRKISNWKLATIAAFFPAVILMLSLQNEIVAQDLPEPSASNEVFTVVEQMPEYKSGFNEMVKFISGNMKYPKEARQQEIEGTVHISFVVEKDGKLSNVEVIRGLHPTCDAEALRVVKQMPAWNPGLQAGKAVRTSMILPINFKL